MNAFLSVEEMIIENQPLVYYLVKKFGVEREDYEDIVSEGTIGLIKAAKTFDASKNVKFATYASRCIKNEIFMYMRKEKKYSKNTISLETPIKEDKKGNTITIMDILPSKVNFTKDITDDTAFCQFMNIVLNCLQSNEKIVMLYKISNKKQIEIAKIVNISQSYVSRVESRVSKKIKSYIYNDTECKGAFKMDKVGTTYRITFSSKDIEQFNKALASVMEEAAEIKNFPEFNVTNKKGRIKIVLPADSESFVFVAKLIQQMDRYSVKFVNK